MSMFNAFGQGGFAALAQTLENIGNIVAPIAPDENERPERKGEREEDEEDDEGGSFDDRVQGFFNQFRDNIAREHTHMNVPAEPGSPESMVSVELGSESPRSAEGKGSQRPSILSAKSPVTSLFGAVSSAELEQKVGQKYREKLESEIEYADQRYADLERSTAKRIAQLEQEVQEWRDLAEGSQSGNIMSDGQEREEEMATLYEKLGSLTSDLEERDEELDSARHMIRQLKEQLYDKDLAIERMRVEHQQDIDELSAQLESQRSEVSALLEQLEEAQDLQQQAESRERKLQAERTTNDEQLDALTNQLRASNKRIASLEEQLLAAAERNSPPNVPTEQAGMVPEASLQEVQVRLAEKEQMVLDLQATVARMATEADARYQQLAQELAQSQSLHADLQHQLRDSEAALEQAQQAHSQASAALDQARSELAASEDARRLAVGEAAHHAAAVARLQAEVERLASGLQAAEVERARVATEHAERVAALETAVEEHNVRSQQLAAALADNQAVAAAAQAQAEHAARDLVLSQQRVQELVEELHRAQQLASSHLQPASLSSASQEEAPTPATAASVPSTSSEAAVGGGEALANLQSEHNKALKKIKMVNRQLKEKETELARLAEQLSVAVAEKEKVQAANAELEKTLDALSTAFEERSAECAQWRSECERLEHTDSVLSAQVAERQRASAATVDASHRDTQETRDKLRALQEALAQSEAALKEAEEAVALSKAEAAELLFAYELEQAAHKTTATARDSLQEQMTRMMGETRRLIRADSMDSVVSEAADKDGASAAAPVEDPALMAARSDYAKAIKKIKLVNRQLKEKDTELADLRGRMSVAEGEVGALRIVLADRDAQIASLSAGAERRAAGDQQVEHQLLTQLKEKEAMVVALQEQLRVAQTSANDALSERDKATQELIAEKRRAESLVEETQQSARRVQELQEAVSELQTQEAELKRLHESATQRVVALEAVLSASEEALKAAEENAWQSKAEAAELLFANEQEQGKVVAAVAAREELRALLDQRQQEVQQLKAEVSSAANKTDVSAVRERLDPVHQALAHALAQLQSCEVPGADKNTGRINAKALDEAMRSVGDDLNALLHVLVQMSQELGQESVRVVTSFREQSERISAVSSELTKNATTWSTERTQLLAQVEAVTLQLNAAQADVRSSTTKYDDLLQRSHAEKQHMAASLQAAQAGTEQLQSLRGQIQKWETENKQLHQVIAQLRQVRKANKGESDNAIAERDELRNQCAHLQAEVANLQERLRYCEANDAAVVELRSEVAALSASLAQSERNLEATRRALSQREKECYDKGAELEVTRSDMLLMRQELERRMIEVTNLQDAVSQVESEKTFAISRFQRELTDKLDACKRTAAAERQELENSLRKALEEEREKRQKLETSTQEYELFYRKAEMEFSKEKKKMQRTLENALQQLNNSQSQVIDRMLVANLIVSYFQRRRSTDVLKIIAKVLAFNDEQLIAVGLKVPPIDLLGTLLTTVIGRPAPKPEVEGENLAEQWINFLINESDQDASNSAGLVGRARSGSNTSAGSPRHAALASPTASGLGNTGTAALGGGGGMVGKGFSSLMDEDPKKD